MRISDWSSDVCSSDLGSRRFQWKRYAPAILTAFLPMLLSLVIYFTYEEKGSPVHVVVVQPNMDPYGEKYDGLSEQDQLWQLITLSDSLGQPNTEYFIWPETAIGTQNPLEIGRAACRERVGQ